jgi:hypothetical protein
MHVAAPQQSEHTLASRKFNVFIDPFVG